MEKRNQINTTTLNQLPVSNYGKIKYICYEAGTKKYFQKFIRSQLISKKWFHISEEPVLEKNKKIITLSNIPDAIYDVSLDALYFRDIAKIKTIFRGIEKLYREATQTEVDEFLKQDFVELIDDYNPEKVKVANRKRIAAVLDRMEKLNKSERSEIFDYINEYCPDVGFNDGKFAISTEDDLKYVLFGIDERYYTTMLGKEKRLANSIVTL